MCVSTGPAEFSSTILYCGRRNHAEHGWIEVFGYQNTAVNRTAGANAMLLHLPARAVSAASFLPVGRAERVLHDMVDAVNPAAADILEDGFPIAVDWMDSRAVEVFEHDVYTIVLAQNAADIPDALGRVEPRKRPALNRELFAFYAELFPDYPVALCCFDNADAAEAKPLMLWYRPLDEDRLALPAIDCHTGAVPDLGALVPTDHWVLFGSDRAEPDWGEPVDYDGMPGPELLEFLPSRVMGRYFGRSLPNGDFAVGHDDLLRGDLELIERVRPN